MGRLQDKVIIVTGASRGLGQYMAYAMAAEGATIVVAARTEQVTDERLPGTIYEAAQTIEERGGKALAVRCNVGDPASIDEMVKKTLDAYGRIDGLVNNAAVQPPGRITTILPRHWDLEFRVNVNGPFHATRAVLETMRAQKSGNIINISSAGANRAAEGQAGHYGVTKVALEAMTKAFSYELRDDGIAVNVLKPRGGIATPGFLFARGGVNPGGTVEPDDFNEAAVIMATATVQTLTGEALFEHEVLERWGRGASLAG
jgi:NAD(P)-dependent dehydrogenase (short-subunit alcohol dehydrogenase family)